MTDLEEKLESEIREHESAAAELRTMLADLRGTDTNPPEMPLPDFLAKKTEVRWLVGGLIGQGSLGFLVGDSHTGKTCLAVQLALHLSVGKAFVGWHVPQPSRCLYAFAEGARELVRTRIETAANTIGCGVPQDFWVQSESFRDFEIKRGGVARLIERTKPHFVILDTLERFSRHDENSASEWKRDVLDPLSRLIHEYGCSIMLIHHSGKESELRKGWQRARGTSAMYADVDFWFRLEAENGIIDNSRTLHVDKSKFGISGTASRLTFDKQAAVMRWDLASPDVPISTVKDVPALSVFDEQEDEL